LGWTQGRRDPHRKGLRTFERRALEEGRDATRVSFDRIHLTPLRRKEIFQRNVKTIEGLKQNLICIQFPKYKDAACLIRRRIF
jgi:hypothetical protein